MTDTLRKTLITRGERAIYELRRNTPADQPQPNEWQLAAAVVDSIPRREWYAVSCEQFRDNVAAKELGERNITFCRPMIFRHPDDDDYHLGRMEYRFPGYLLALIDISLGEHTIVERCPGVEGLVKGAAGDRETPTPLKPETVLALLRFQDADFARALQKRPTKREDLYEGCEVEIDDSNHHQYGKRGTLMVLERKLGKVMVDMSPIYWSVRVEYLKRVAPPPDPKKAKKLEKKAKKAAAKRGEVVE